MAAGQRQCIAVILIMSDLYLNGEYVPEAEAQVSVMDRGFLFGDGVYEVIPAYDGQLLRGDEHLQRLDASLASIRMDNPLDHQQWKTIFKHLLGLSPEPNQYLYLQVTRGAEPVRDHLIPAGIEPTVMAMARPIKARKPQFEEQGVAVVTRDDIRWSRCDIKSVALLAAVLMRQEAEDEGAQETILVRDGNALEGSSANLFIVSNGLIITPPKSRLLLAGITRGLILDLAREAGLRCSEQAVPAKALEGADEVWISSSTREVLPVTRLNGDQVGDGRPGPVWRQINALYQDYKERVRAGDV